MSKTANLLHKQEASKRLGGKVVGRPLRVTLFRSGLSKVGFLNLHIGRDGKMQRGGAEGRLATSPLV